MREKRREKREREGDYSEISSRNKSCNNNMYKNLKVFYNNDEENLMKKVEIGICLNRKLITFFFKGTVN